MVFLLCKYILRDYDNFGGNNKKGWGISVHSIYSFVILFYSSRSTTPQQHSLKQINTETCVAYGVTSEIRTTTSGEYEDIHEYYT